MARPRKNINAEQVEAMARVGCTVEEMALILNCGERLLQSRFRAAMERGRANMRMSLRRLQLKAAENGNAALLIWLGKQHLNQRDKVEIDYRIASDIESELARLGLAEAEGVSTAPPADTDPGLVN